MLILLALTACLDPEEAFEEVRQTVAPDDDTPHLQIATIADVRPARVAPVVDAPLPTGEPIVRDCFGRGNKDIAANKGGGKMKPRPRPTPRPSPAASPRPRIPSTASAPSPDASAGPASAPSRPALSKEETRTANEGLGARGRGAGGGGVGGLVGGDAPADGFVSRGDADFAAPVAQKKKAPEKPVEQQRRTSGLDDDAVAVMDELAVAEPEAEPAPIEEGEELADEEDAKTQGPVMDWGATVHLSNDDSMSLASAQRVLYALSRGVSLSPSEIRPHELLNYFSFDTAELAEGQMFGVLGGAETDGDTMTVSLAVKGANPPRQPLDLSIVLDRSCSMSAEGRMEYTRRGLTQLSDNLQEGDRVDVVLFDSGVCTPLENFVVGRDDPELLTSVIGQLSPTSSTDLNAGLREAYRIQTDRDPAEVHQRNRRMLLITDAQLNSGNVDEDLVSEVGHQFEDNDIRLTGIGVGRDFNDDMLNKLTEKGKGAYVYLGSEAVVDRVFGPGFDALTRTIAHDVRFALELPDSLAMERFYGEEASTDPEDVQPIHYYAGTTQLFLQDLKMKEGQPVRSDPVVMKISYRDAATGEPETQELRTTVGALLDGDPHNLRKGRALMAFTDVVMAKAMRANPCGEPLQTYRSRLGGLSDDAEIGFVNGLVGKMCGVDLAVAVQPGVAYKVKVDSDIPISSVGLDCGGRTTKHTLSGSDTVARFDDAVPGTCEVKLQGQMQMVARVEVPEVGGDVRCIVRGGRIRCE